VFAVLLAGGNSILSNWISGLFSGLFAYFKNWDFSFGRLVFWALMTVIPLMLLMPDRPPEHRRFWLADVPRFPTGRPEIGQWRAIAILCALNLLFFAANTIDVFFLWARATLPDGVTASSFVHQGVWSLIGATLLAALVLAALFQESVAVTRHRSIRYLAYAWIAQNILLVLSVLLRLKLYVDEFQWTTLRVYVGCFLLLVSVGFLLLALHVRYEWSLNRLIVANMAAVLALFYVVQFLPVEEWVARNNVAAYLKDPQRGIDLAYLDRLGPGAWPALAQLAASDLPAAGDAQGRLEEAALAEKERRTQTDWRSWQLRRHRLAQWLGGSTQ
jgi:hypothetical protein